jgi:uncharacterized protein (TIGR03083 family)
MSTEPTASDWLAALRASQQTLSELVSPLSDAEVEAPSYASEWSIAQVLSHLGSGAEIFSMFLAAGRDGTPAPGFEAFQPVWDAWNAKSPADQAHDGLRADAAYVDELEALDDAQRDAWRLEMFGGEQRLGDLIRLRLGEHTLHTWDIAVMADAAATLPAESVSLLVDAMDQLVGRAGKSPEQPVAIQIATENPARDFLLHATGEATALSVQDPGDRPDGDATVRLPAEALIRLFYGRLDPAHTPPLDAEGIDVDTLRLMFPGV